MTIEQFSIQEGFDLAQNAINNSRFQKHVDNGVFLHYCANEEGYVNLSNDGIKYHDLGFIYISTLPDNTPLEDIKADFKAIINATEYIPIPNDGTFEPLV